MGLRWNGPRLRTRHWEVVMYRDPRPRNLFWFSPRPKPKNLHHMHGLLEFDKCLGPRVYPTINYSSSSFSFFWFFSFVTHGATDDHERLIFVHRVTFIDSSIDRWRWKRRRRSAVANHRVTEESKYQVTCGIWWTGFPGLWGGGPRLQDSSFSCYRIAAFYFFLKIKTLLLFLGIFDFVLFCRGFTPGLSVTGNTLTPFLLNLSRVKE